MIEIVALAGSAGGLEALRLILADLPATFEVPILVLLHTGDAEDGDQRFLDIDATPLSHAGDGYLGASITFTDVTGRCASTGSSRTRAGSWRPPTPTSGRPTRSSRSSTGSCRHAPRRPTG